MKGNFEIKMLPVLLALLLFSAAAYGEGVLTPEPDRITDEAIASDIREIRSLQVRLARLNDAGVPVGSYHFAKAQAWIDFAMDEYTMNDRGSVIEETFAEALFLIEEMELRVPEITMETPIIPTSRKVREDLWQKAEAWKDHPGFHCAEDRVAQLEVQLVWAGHEDVEFGWRNSKPYLQAAERLAREAGELIDGCTPKPSPAPAAVAVAVSELPESRPLVPVRIHFGYDSTGISPQSAVLLDRVASVMAADPQLTLDLVGHADARDPRKTAYNYRIAEGRAEAVARYLADAGIATERITRRSAAINKPLADGSDLQSLARNRSVELFLLPGDGAAPPSFDLRRSEEDLQVESPAFR